MSSIITIKLKDLKFYSHIGVGEQERKVGNEFRINVEIAYPGSLFQYEDLGSTISYAEVYEIIESVMKAEYLLLESVASDISTGISNHWPNILSIKIELIKVVAPIPGICGESGIEYFWKKS